MNYSLTKVSGELVLRLGASIRVVTTFSVELIVLRLSKNVTLDSQVLMVVYYEKVSVLSKSYSLCLYVRPCALFHSE